MRTVAVVVVMVVGNASERVWVGVCVFRATKVKVKENQTKNTHK
jgi:hypothetical protein